MRELSVRRLAISVAAALLLAQARPVSAHDLPMGGSRWCFGPSSIVANIDLAPALLGEIKGMKEGHYSLEGMSDEQMRQVAANVLQPYINERLSITEDGKSYPVKVDRLVSNGDIYTIWLSVGNVAFSHPVAIDYSLLFEETNHAHVNLAYGYLSDATGDALRRVFDFSPPAMQNTFDHSAHVWRVVVPGAAASGAPKAASKSSEPAARHGDASVSTVKGMEIRSPSAARRTAVAAAHPSTEASRPADRAELPPARMAAPGTSRNDSGCSAAAVPAAQESRWASVGKFILLGIEHILTGYDHIAFLLAVIVIGLSLREVLKIITAFTVAHSITLLLAALEVVKVNSRLVEAIIAGSICYVALENLYMRRAGHRWLLTFGFGLVHGFGFASALRELIVGRSNLLVSVVSFNLGVELGQVMIFLVVLPVLHLLTRWVDFRRVTTGASVAVFLLGLTWLVERGFHLKVLPI